MITGVNEWNPTFLYVFSVLIGGSLRFMPNYTAYKNFEFLSSINSKVDKQRIREVITKPMGYWK